MTGQVDGHEEFQGSFQCRNCLFCLDDKQRGKQSIGNYSSLLNKALFRKYSYAPMKPDHNILLDRNLSAKIKKVLNLGDKHGPDEILKRFYQSFETQDKLKRIFEYYKYHMNIPRNFIQGIYKMTTFFYEQIKYLKYKEIKKLLGIPQEDSKTLKEDLGNTPNQGQDIANLNFLNELSYRQKTAQSETTGIIANYFLQQEIITKDDKPVNISDSWKSMSINRDHQGQAFSFKQSHLGQDGRASKPISKQSKLEKFLTLSQSIQPNSNLRNYISEKNRIGQLQINSEAKPLIKRNQNQFFNPHKLTLSPTIQSQNFKNILQEKMQAPSLIQSRKESAPSISVEKTTIVSDKQNQQHKLQNFLLKKQLNEVDFRKFLLIQLKTFNKLKEQNVQNQSNLPPKNKPIPQTIYKLNSPKKEQFQVQKTQQSSPIHHSNTKKVLTLSSEPPTSPLQKLANFQSFRRLSSMIQPTKIAPPQQLKKPHHTHTYSLPNMINGSTNQIVQMAKLALEPTQPLQKHIIIYQQQVYMKNKLIISPQSTNSLSQFTMNANSLSLQGQNKSQHYKK